MFAQIWSWLRMAVWGIIMGLAGCGTEYTYTPPASATGQACIMRCQGVQNTCVDTEKQRAEKEEAECETNAEHAHYMCLLYAKTDADRAKCQKDGCYEYADTGSCDSAFRACFQQCGGVVGVMK